MMVPPASCSTRPSQPAIMPVMSRGYQANQERLFALQGLGKDLARRAKSHCEITGIGGVPLQPWEVPPVPDYPDLDRTVLICSEVAEALDNPDTLAGPRWHCLAERLWSDVPAVQVLAWRMLAHLAESDHWAREALEQADLAPDTLAWAQSEPL
jgi:protein PhnA